MRVRIRRFIKKYAVLDTEPSSSLVLSCENMRYSGLRLSQTIWTYARGFSLLPLTLPDILAHLTSPTLDSGLCRVKQSPAKSGGDYFHDLLLLSELQALILTAQCSLVYFEHIAEVAEQADAHDSKSCSLGSVGSIPTFGISYLHRAHYKPFLNEKGFFNIRLSRLVRRWDYLGGRSTPKHARFSAERRNSGNYLRRS
jgi:hypothetical protein